MEKVYSPKTYKPGSKHPGHSFLALTTQSTLDFLQSSRLFHVYIITETLSLVSRTCYLKICCFKSNQPQQTKQTESKLFICFQLFSSKQHYYSPSDQITATHHHAQLNQALFLNSSQWFLDRFPCLLILHCTITFVIKTTYGHSETDIHTGPFRSTQD